MKDEKGKKRIEKEKKSCMLQWVKHGGNCNNKPQKN